MEKAQAELINTFLDVELSKYGRKKFIEDCVKIYRSDFNEEYIEHLQNIKKFREQQENKYAWDKKSDVELRWGASVPTRLFSVLQSKLEKPLGDKEELRWFIKTFPEFGIPEKV